MEGTVFFKKHTVPNNFALSCQVVVFETKKGLPLVGRCLVYFASFPQNFTKVQNTHVSLDILCSGLDLARFPIRVLRCALNVPEYTLTRVYQVIAWSLKDSWDQIIFCYFVNNCNIFPDTHLGTNMTVYMTCFFNIYYINMYVCMYVCIYGDDFFRRC